jgi:hypothetical protein
MLLAKKDMITLEFIDVCGKPVSGMQDNNSFTSFIFLFRCFVEAPDIVSLLGAQPKADSSHGFPMYQTYEMYRDF